MTTPVTHSTFSIERTYPVSPERVFAAFAEPATKRRWFVEGDAWETQEFTSDFRVGGFERSRFRFKGNDEVPAAPMGNDTVYLDILPARRIVFAYSMSMNGANMSASLATIELTGVAEGTRLLFTEQAAFFEGSDGAQLREGGWRELLGKLADVVSEVGGAKRPDM